MFGHFGWIRRRGKGHHIESLVGRSSALNQGIKAYIDGIDGPYLPLESIPRCVCKVRIT
jgi:hypothetical protein